MQLSYEEAPAGSLGLIAEDFSMNQIDSHAVGTADLEFGMPVQIDSGMKVKKLVLEANFIGVCAAAQYEQQAISGNGKIEVGRVAPIMTQGRIWVKAGEAVSFGDEVVPAASGKFSKGESTSNVVAIVRSEGLADGDLVLIQLIPQMARA